MKNFANIGKLERLETVQLDSNMLEYFAIIPEKLASLRELDLHDNWITSLHSSLLGCTQLELLDVGDNKLCSVDPAVAEWLDTRDPDWKETQRCK